jgi:hypothetical protein
MSESKKRFRITLQSNPKVTPMSGVDRLSGLVFDKGVAETDDPSKVEYASSQASWLVEEILPPGIAPSESDSQEGTPSSVEETSAPSEEVTESPNQPEEKLNPGPFGKNKKK